MSNIVVQQQAITAFEPTNIRDAYDFAKMLVASRMLPRHLTTPEAVVAVVATGREIGLTTMQSVRNIYFVDGKVTLSADLIVSLVKRHPACEYFRVSEATNESVTCETKRKGDPEPTTMTWTLKDAERAGLLNKDNWKKYPKAMLRARCSSDLARAVYPDAAMGVYDPDELSAPMAVEPSRIDVPVTAAPEESVDYSQQVADFSAAIESASTIESLAAVGKAIKDAKLPASVSKPLKDSFAAKKSQLSTPEEVTA